jgi:hypothetical protein
MVGTFALRLDLRSHAAAWEMLTGRPVSISPTRSLCTHNHFNLQSGFPMTMISTMELSLALADVTTQADFDGATRSE